MSEDIGTPITPGEVEPRRNTTLIVIAVVVLVLLCCCCSSLVLAWQYGDSVWEWFNRSALLLGSGLV